MSTEFTVGLSSNQRISSKVLKPPGGGSSNIFGYSDDKVDRSIEKKTEVKNVQPIETHTAATEPNLMVPKSAKKKQVMRNPITGEEVELKPQENVKFDETERHVIRNCITGGEVEVYPHVTMKVVKHVMINPMTGEEVDLKPQENVKFDETERHVVRNPITGEMVRPLPKQEKPKEEEIKKPLVTSIRVKNPPGGKSTFSF